MRPESTRGAGSRDGEDLDDVDRLLITQLQTDGRLSYSEPGALAGLPAGGARRRVLRLQERGVLEVVGVTDPLKLGYRSMAMLGIRVTGDVNEVADAIGSLEEVIYLVLVAGSIDLLVEVIAPDAGALFGTINEKIRRVPGVGQLETFTYYRTHTHRFTCGAR
ncbi:Lrp/AsnC family transcriptional regulator [Arthrobacter deserti]|uniref:Lrp/AsnC family transcriptional regulator n=1 Tax=Arthrobacter deserti TaxID=1742687 RepID=A0ABX1JTD9_9MICC|nr:Lrp/AsnC family transcriptional regulator [Arthrobacter deserti]